MTCNIKTLLMCIATLTLISGCGGSAESEDIRTPGIHAEFKVTANGNGSTNVSADLEVGSGGILGATDLSLSGNDTLSATSDTVTKPLDKETDFLGEITYETTFSGDAEGTQFVIAFEREGDTSAPNSYVSLPEPLVVNSPVTDDRFDFDEDITLTWEASFNSDELRVQTQSECPIAGGSSFSGSSFTTVDDGSFTISALEALGSAHDDSPSQSICEVKIIIRRVNIGHLDPNFGEGGSIEGVQKRTIEISVVL